MKKKEQIEKEIFDNMYFVIKSEIHFCTDKNRIPLFNKNV